MFWIIVIGFMIASWAVGARLRSKFNRYSQEQLRRPMSGAQAAEQMLADHGLHDVQIIQTPGRLTDHYNPVDRTINLSEEVFYGQNAAAVAIAAHETGHAVQHANAYAPLKMRSALVPVQAASARILNVIFIASLVAAFTLPAIFPYELAMILIIASYGVMSVFSLVTLPVEFDASKRALAWMSDSGVVTSQEHAKAKDALHWAAMTYVVAALASLSMLLYYLASFLSSD